VYRISSSFTNRSTVQVRSLKDLGEFGFLDRLQRSLPPREGHVIRGVGDDCAVLTVPEGEKVLWTVDTLVEGVHFRMDLIDMHDLGWKSLAVNLSDVAAMGGRPLHAVLSLGLPAGTDLPELDAFYEGFSALAGEHSVALVGGDMVKSPSGFLITVSVLGATTGGCFLPRDGAQPGDWIGVTGPPGDSAAGLSLLLDSKGETGNQPSSDLLASLIQAHNRPRPQVREGIFFAGHAGVHAAIDLSDGLLQDLWHVCRQSGTGAVVEQGRLPLSEAIRELAACRGVAPEDWALFGGEDYHLLVAVQADCFEELRARYEAQFQKRLHPIGRMTSDRGIQWETTDGKRRELEPVGYDHFRERTFSGEGR
jgi:thiamine-monophosphate kinase